MATICTEQNRSDFKAVIHPVNFLRGRSQSRLTLVTVYARKFLSWIECRREQRESRDAFAHLLKLDDSLLRDIGVTRAEVERAARLPLAEDAAQVLNEASGRSRCKRV